MRSTLLLRQSQLKLHNQIYKCLSRVNHCNNLLEKRFTPQPILSFTPSNHRSRPNPKSGSSEAFVSGDQFQVSTRVGSLFPFTQVRVGARMASQSPATGTYTWRINFFSLMNQKKYYSDVFTVGSCKWRLLIFPKGNGTEHFAIYLDVPDSATLPTGWAREASITLTMVNQKDRSASTKKETRHQYNANQVDWGFALYKPLTELHDCSKGFLVRDTVIVEVKVEVHSVVPPVVTPQATRSPPAVVPAAVTAPATTEADRFDDFFSKLEELIVTAKTSSSQEVPASTKSNDHMSDLISGSPGLVEVEEAKQSLRECLSDLFKLNMKDRLASALLTLSRAEVGLSSDQRKSIRAFRDNFDEFISDFLNFEQDNSEFELQKLARDKMFSAIKKNRDTHLSNKQLMESLNKEEEDIKKRMEEVKMRKEKLMSDWDSLRSGSEEAMSKYSAQEKKLAEAEEKKRIAEEGMSRSAAAWSSLKTLFLGNSA